MSRCEDWPCCGHEAGCCPSRDPETGEQTDMKCVCGASVPLSSRTSLCFSCLHSDDDFGEDEEDEEDFDEDDFGPSFDEDQSNEYDDPFSYNEDY